MAKTAIWLLAQTHLRDQNGVPVVKVGMKNPLVTVYSFNHDISLVDLTGTGQAGSVPLLQLIEVNNGQLALKKATADAIDGILDSRNLTWLNGAIKNACQYTQPVTPNGILFLFTDGKPTTPTKKGPFNVPVAMRETKKEMGAFLKNCSTAILTGINVEGTDAEVYLKALGEEESEDFFYTNISTEQLASLPRPLSITFEGLGDPYLGLRPDDVVTIVIRWQPDDPQTEAPEAFSWGLMLSYETGEAFFAGQPLGLSTDLMNVDSGRFDERGVAEFRLTVWEPGDPSLRMLYLQAAAFRTDSAMGPGDVFVSNILQVEILEGEDET